MATLAVSHTFIPSGSHLSIFGPLTGDCTGGLPGLTWSISLGSQDRWWLR